MLTAKLTQERQNAVNRSHNKEIISTYNAVVSTKNGLKDVVNIRSYMGRSNMASVVYSSIWVNGKNFWTSGAGSAGGCGYHKESAAIDEAIQSAGIELFGNLFESGNTKKRTYIHGVGETAIIKAIEAIVKACGYKGKCLIVRN